MQVTQVDVDQVSLRHGQQSFTKKSTDQAWWYGSVWLTADPSLDSSFITLVYVCCHTEHTDWSGPEPVNRQGQNQSNRKWCVVMIVVVNTMLSHPSPPPPLCVLLPDYEMIQVAHSRLLGLLLCLKYVVMWHFLDQVFQKSCESKELWCENKYFLSSCLCLRILTFQHEKRQFILVLLWLRGNKNK